MYLAEQLVFIAGIEAVVDAVAEQQVLDTAPVATLKLRCAVVSFESTLHTRYLRAKITEVEQRRHIIIIILVSLEQ